MNLIIMKIKDKKAIKILVLIIILIVSSSDILAQTRIRFARGKSSATVTGTIAKNGSKCYFLSANEGQWLKAKLRSRSGDAQFLFYMGASPYKGGTSYETTTTKGDNEVCIENPGNSTTFTLTVSIR